MSLQSALVLPLGNPEDDWFLSTQDGFEQWEL
jgi:hypothetical protein